MNIPSLKKTLIHQYLLLAERDELKGNVITLITTAGTIIGTIIEKIRLKKCNLPTIFCPQLMNKLSHNIIQLLNWKKTKHFPRTMVFSV